MRALAQERDEPFRQGTDIGELEMLELPSDAGESLEENRPIRSDVNGETLEMGGGVEEGVDECGGVGPGGEGEMDQIGGQLERCRGVSNIREQLKRDQSCSQSTSLSISLPTHLASSRAPKRPHRVRRER